MTTMISTAHLEGSPDGPLPPEVLLRRTKVLATLGPATDAPGVLDEMVSAGVNAVRINCSHGEADERRERIARTRDAAARANRPVGVLLDLQGPKIRLSPFQPTREVSRGDVVTFVPGPPLGDDVGVDWGMLGPAAEPGRSEIAIGDGTPRFLVSSVDDDGRRVTASCLSPGRLEARKGITVTYSNLGGPALTDKDRIDLDLAAELDVDFVALSFVREAGDIEELRRELAVRGARARVIAKIERLQALENLDEILDAADGVMVARGDLGVEAGVARIALMQKRIIDSATLAGKVCITATQMLESMITAPEPTRAEALDVANAVLDGTSAVMLSAETAMGQDPSAAVRAMAEIASEAERAEHIYCINLERQPGGPGAAVMKAAVLLGRDTDAGILVVPTASGGSARSCAKYRPKRPIIALAQDESVAGQLTLDWGVVAGTLDSVDGIDDLIGTALANARRLTGLADETTVVMTAGPAVAGDDSMNLIVVRHLGDAG
jgi:pyruvate kinase